MEWEEDSLQHLDLGLSMMPEKHGRANPTSIGDKPKNSPLMISHGPPLTALANKT